MKLLLIVINIFLLVLILRLVKGIKREKKRNSIMEEQNKCYIKELELVRESQKQVQLVQHDLNNHILAMKLDMEKGRYQEVKAYLENLFDSIAANASYVDTGSLTFDGILNYKIDIARREGIMVNQDVQLPENIPLDPFDMSILLGNLLDNAIEAAKMGTEDEKLLNVFVKLQGNQLHLQIENSYSGNIEWKNGNPVTKKKSKAVHGLGLQSVRKAVEKYDGIIECFNKDGKFIVKVMLYL